MSGNWNLITFSGALWKHSPSAVILPCFLRFRLLLEKNADGPLERTCSGLNGPWTFSCDLLKKASYKQKLCRAFPSLLSVCLWIHFKVLVSETFSQSVNRAPARRQAITVKVICFYILRLSRDTWKWTYGQRLRKSLQLGSFPDGGHEELVSVAFHCPVLSGAKPTTTTLQWALMPPVSSAAFKWQLNAKRRGS